MKRFARCALLPALLALVSLAEAETLVNPGFETGDFTGWTLTGTADSGVDVDGTLITGVYDPYSWTTAEVNVHSGEYAALAKVSAYNTFELSQTVSVTPNTDYDVGIWGSWGGESYSGAGSVNKILIDDVEVFASSGLLGGTGPEDYTHIQTLWSSGLSTSVYATFYFTRTAVSTTPMGFSFDDAHFNPVAIPTPSTLVGLVGMGLMGAFGYVWRRRRRVA